MAQAIEAVALSRPAGSAPREMDVEVWVGLAVLLFALTAAAWLARRRSRSREPEEASRFVRIVFSTGAFVAILAAVAVATEAAGRSSQSDSPFVMILGLAGVALIALLLFAVVDFALGLFRPRRSRRWLVAAILVFALLFVLILIGGAFWIDDAVESVTAAEAATFAAVGAAVGLVWWAYLPPPSEDVAGRFE